MCCHRPSRFTLGYRHRAADLGCRSAWRAFVARHAARLAPTFWASLLLYAPLLVAYRASYGERAPETRRTAHRAASHDGRRLRVAVWHVVQVKGTW